MAVVKYKGSGSDGGRVARSKWESDISSVRINIRIDAGLGWSVEVSSRVSTSVRMETANHHRVSRLCSPGILWHGLRVTQARARQNITQGVTTQPGSHHHMSRAQVLRITSAAWHRKSGLQSLNQLPSSQMKSDSEMNDHSPAQILFLAPVPASL